MTRSTTYFTPLEPMSSDATARLTKWRMARPKQTLAFDLYEQTLRSDTPTSNNMQPLSLRRLARDLDVPRRQVNSAVEFLQRSRFLERLAAPDGGLWLRALDVPDLLRSRRTGFRNDVIWLDGRTPALTREQLSSLYRLFQDHPVGVARLYFAIRKCCQRGDESTSLDSLARSVGLAGDTSLGTRFVSLDQLGLVTRDFAAQSIVLQAPPEMTPDDELVDQEILNVWLDDATSLVSFDDVSVLARVSRRDARVDLLLRFYDACHEAIRQRRKRASEPVETGNKTTNTLIARRLLKDRTFQELQPYIFYYVCAWEDDSIDRFGRTLLTFEKQIQKMLDDFHGEHYQRQYERRLHEYGLAEEWGNLFADKVPA